MRPTRGLMVHQRTGGPMKRVAGRVATAPAWTAVEVARELVGLADGNAESEMESEARLVMIDHGLPLPKLQYEVRGRDGRAWRVDDVRRDPRGLTDRIAYHLSRSRLAG